MPKSPELPKKYTPEEIADLEKSRTISDAELLKGGAKYEINQDGDKHLKLAEDQHDWMPREKTREHLIRLIESLNYNDKIEVAYRDESEDIKYTGVITFSEYSDEILFTSFFLLSIDAIVDIQLKERSQRKYYHR